MTELSKKDANKALKRVKVNSTIIITLFLRQCDEEPLINLEMHILDFLDQELTNEKSGTDCTKGSGQNENE